MTIERTGSAIDSLLRRGLRRLRRTIWPTEMERSHRRWVADRGDETRRLDYRLEAGAIVLDVGGYEGRWTEQVVGRFDCRVHVFEPVAEFAAAIQSRLGGSGRVSVHAYGLAARDGEVDFHLSADGSSALRGLGEPRRVRMRAAAGVFQELGFERVDLMKINIEGGEYELLEHLLERDLAARVRHLQVQFHDFVPGARPRMRAILSRLASTHEPEWQYPFVWESWRLRPSIGRPAPVGS